MTPGAHPSAEEYEMADSIKKLVCCMLLLALAGTVSGAGGIVLAGQAGIAAPVNQPVAGSCHGDRGLGSITGEAGTTMMGLGGCYFPIWRLPEYYVCIMFCKIGGGGDTCAPSCEAKLRSVHEYYRRENIHQIRKITFFGYTPGITESSPFTRFGTGARHPSVRVPTFGRHAVTGPGST